MAGSMRTRADHGPHEGSLPRVRLASTKSDGYAVDLADPLALDPEIAGAKAAALARATALGLPVLPGFVVTTESVRGLLEDGRLEDAADARVREAWASLSGRGSCSLVVRSSSVGEDGAASSMAGMFTSVTNVMGLEAFLEALQIVARSSFGPHGAGLAMPMGVLVQPFLPAKLGGVLFGVDPVTGSEEHLVVAAVEGPPEDLVSGRVQGSRYVLKKNGRVVEAEAGPGGAMLGGARRRALAGLAAHARNAFGAPQDVEWAIDTTGRLWLLQSRPVTATGPAAKGTGPLLGPGPVAETFPGTLSLLEEDLWVRPLREALRTALLLVRSAPRKRITESSIVVVVRGRVAADLELLGGTVAKKSFLRRLDPRPPARRLRAGWDVGRLRTAIPTLARDLVAVVDEELAKVPPLSEMTDASLADLLSRAQASLKAINGHEVLAGMLMAPDAVAPSGASLGFRALARGRSQGLEDAEISARYPEVLALVPPSIERARALPEKAPELASSGPVDPIARAREECRMRARWVHELSARVAREIGSRFARAGILQDQSDVLLLTVAEIQEMVSSRRFPTALDRRGATVTSPPLPSMFRLSEDGTVVAETTGGPCGGRGAGGGRAKGRVVHDPDLAEPGDVLVVTTLDPDLAAVLPGLGGLIAETGSVLSHLAILAREFGVATVVGVPGATADLAVGDVVLLDGTTGEITPVEDTSQASL